MNAPSRHSRLENAWLWFVAIAFTAVGFIACIYWIYAIVQFFLEIFNG